MPVVDEGDGPVDETTDVLPCSVPCANLPRTVNVRPVEGVPVIVRPEGAGEGGSSGVNVRRARRGETGLAEVISRASDVAHQIDEVALRRE